MSEHETASFFNRLKRGMEESIAHSRRMPNPLRKGNCPAAEFVRAAIARDIIKARRKAGLSQAELAGRAGIQPAALNRIEKEKVDAETYTVEKIMVALKAAKSLPGK